MKRTEYDNVYGKKMPRGLVAVKKKKKIKQYIIHRVKYVANI